MKIAIVGNSHASALKLALTASPDQYPHAFDFLVKAARSGQRLEWRDGRLYMVSDGGSLSANLPGTLQDGLDPGLYDGIVFAAAGMPACHNRNAKHPLNIFQHADFASPQHVGLRRVSGTELAQVIANALLASPIMRAIQLTRSVFAGPLVITTTPLPGLGIGQCQIPSDLPSVYGERLSGFMSWYHREQTRVIGEEASRLGAGLIAPPTEYLNAGYTPEEFCTADPWHMNSRYGRIMLDRALAFLERPAH